MRDWFCARSWRAETLVLTILNVVSNIKAFLLACLGLGFRIGLHRAEKSPSSLVGVVGGWIWIHMCRSRYSACYLRVELRRQIICTGYYLCGILVHYLPHKFSNNIIYQYNNFHIHVLGCVSK